MNLVRTMQDYIKKYHLSKCVPYELDSEESIRAAYQIFFNTSIKKEWYVEVMANRILADLRDVNMTVDEYIDMQADAFTECCRFLHNYDEYCIARLLPEQCNMLIHMAPGIDARLIYILEVVQEEMRKYYDLRAKQLFFGKKRGRYS